MVVLTFETVVGETRDLCRESKPNATRFHPTPVRKCAIMHIN
jgi:hypothetical protein